MTGAIVGPGYLSKECLPYAADIFYHEKITYYLPTGFHPIEIQNVLNFPQYCSEKRIAMPSYIWEMPQMYFENGVEAKECIDILEPLKGKYVIIASSIYSRDISTINKVTELINNNPDLIEVFKNSPLELRFIARELLSHVLYEVAIEKGMEGAIDYLKSRCKKTDDFVLLIAAVLINRIKLFSKVTDRILLYDHYWYPLIFALEELNKLEENDKNDDNGGSFNLEHFTFRLFEEILIPVFGRCDNRNNSEKVAKIADTKTKEIQSLKKCCESIASTVCLIPNTAKELKQNKLSELIEKELAMPLAELTENPLKKVRGLLGDFVVDSTVVAGLLSVIQGASVDILTTAAAAGTISSGIKYIVKQSKKRKTPSQLLVTGMKKMKSKYEDVQKSLNEINVDQLDISPQYFKSGSYEE